MVGEIRRLKFSEGVATGAPTQEFIETISYASYVDDAAFVAAVGTPSASDAYFNATDNVVRVYDGSAWHSQVSDDQTQTLTNKTIDIDLNTLSNIEVDNFKAGVVDTDLSSVSASDDTLASAKAIKAYVDTANTAAGTSYDNATSGLTATDVQAAIDEVDGNYDTHIVDTTTHGTTGDIVGTSDAQTLTNKTIAAASNTISGLTHGGEVDSPTSGVHGVTGTVVGTSDAQTLTNKTLDIDLNTLSNIEADNFKTGVIDTDLTSVSASDDTLASAKAIKAYADTKQSEIITTEGDLIVGNSTPEASRLAIGASGTYLRSNGTTAAWATVTTTPLTVSTKSADYVVLDADGIGTILVDDTSVDRTITLPTAADNANRVLTIKNISTDKGKVTVDGEGAETIDGLTTIDLDFKNSFITVVCDGSNWSISATNLTALQKTYSLTVTGTNWTTSTADGRPYRDIEGNWYIVMNINGSTSVSAANITLAISGTTFSSTQAGVHYGASTGNRARVNNAASTALLDSNAAISTWVASFDVMLSSKPTFVE